MARMDSKPPMGEDDKGMGGTDELGRRRMKKRKPPAFVLEDTFVFDYKNPQQLRFFISDRGKIVPRRISGLTAKQQRALTVAIKRARHLALMPYTALD